MIIYVCEHCGHKLGVPRELAGSSTNCPRCNQLVSIPPLSPEEMAELTAQRAGMPPGLPPYMPQPVQVSQTSNKAIASLVLGIASFVLCGVFGFLISIPGIIVGHMAIGEIRREPAKAGSKGLAIAGLIISYANVGLFVLLGGIVGLMAASGMFTDILEYDLDRDICSDNLDSIHAAFRQYAIDENGRYPMLDATPGNLTVSDHEGDEFYDRYLTDETAFDCFAKDFAESYEWSPRGKPYNDQSYVYFGYMVTNMDELQAFSRAYERNLAEAGQFNEPLPADPSHGTAGGDDFLPFGIDEFTEVQSRNPQLSRGDIPVIIEWPENHGGKGGHVLYLDGRVEWIEFPGKWPMDPDTMVVLSGMDRMGN